MTEPVQETGCGALGDRPLPADANCGALGDRPLPADANCGALGDRPLPVRKVLNHRGPISLDITSAWYFITICAENHSPWAVGGDPVGADPRAARAANDSSPMVGGDPVGADPRAARPNQCQPIPLADAAAIFLHEARENHLRGIWRLALFLVMPDHLHFIVHVPDAAFDGALGDRPLPADANCGAHCGALGDRPLPNRNLPGVIGDFKRLLTRRYGLRFQRDFFDTRIRDDEHYGEKFRYVCANPVRKGLCKTPHDWPYVIAFDRMTGEERAHR